MKIYDLYYIDEADFDTLSTTSVLPSLKRDLYPTPPPILAIILPIGQLAKWNFDPQTLALGGHNIALLAYNTTTSPLRTSPTLLILFTTFVV